MTRKINTPLNNEITSSLHAGDRIELSGVVYAARDAAHQRLIGLIESGLALPFKLNGSVIYYLGPSPARPGQVIGAAGPTTSGRMDAFTPRLLELGLRGMIGKGKRSAEVIRAIQANQAVYFAAIGGAGALLASHIHSQKVIAFPELGPEAVLELLVEDFPLIVAIDMHGGNLYDSEVQKYRQT